jgi:hypothetical protein
VLEAGYLSGIEPLSETDEDIPSSQIVVLTQKERTTNAAKFIEYEHAKDAKKRKMARDAEYAYEAGF